MVVAGSKVGMGEVDHCGEGQGVGEQGGVGRDRPVRGGRLGGRSSKFFMYKCENYFIYITRKFTVLFRVYLFNIRDKHFAPVGD